ncbi:MAG: hypothetical protein VB122_07235, partial [Erysipelotrichales bacterium]|nr:hypothetical protein [Erysipelotrichales bacterium]
MLKINSKYIFWQKVLRRISFEKNRLWRYLPVGRISIWGIGQIPDKTIFRQELQRMLGVFDKHLFDTVDAEIKNRIIKDADEALEHNFDLLGSGKTFLDPINWHTDFKTGFEWPKMFYRKL